MGSKPLSKEGQRSKNKSKKKKSEWDDSPWVYILVEIQSARRWYLKEPQI